MVAHGPKAQLLNGKHVASFQHVIWKWWVLVLLRSGYLRGLVTSLNPQTAMSFALASFRIGLSPPLKWGDRFASVRFASVQVSTWLEKFMGKFATLNLDLQLWTLNFDFVHKQLWFARVQTMSTWQRSTWCSTNWRKLGQLQLNVCLLKHFVFVQSNFDCVFNWLKQFSTLIWTMNARAEIAHAQCNFKLHLWQPGDDTLHRLQCSRFEGTQNDLPVAICSPLLHDVKVLKCYASQWHCLLLCEQCVTSISNVFGVKVQRIPTIWNAFEVEWNDVLATYVGKLQKQQKVGRHSKKPQWFIYWWCHQWSMCWTNLLWKWSQDSVMATSVAKSATDYHRRKGYIFPQWLSSIVTRWSKARLQPNQLPARLDSILMVAFSSDWIQLWWSFGHHVTQEAWTIQEGKKSKECPM